MKIHGLPTGPRQWELMAAAWSSKAGGSEGGATTTAFVAADVVGLAIDGLLLGRHARHRRPRAA